MDIASPATSIRRRMRIRVKKMAESNQGKGKKEKKLKDDGRTVANMDIDGMPGHIPQRKRHKQTKAQQEWAKIKLTRKERRAMFWGALLAILPWVLLYGGLFFLLLLLLDLFWLRGFGG